MTVLKQKDHSLIMLSVKFMLLANFLSKLTYNNRINQVGLLATSHVQHQSGEGNA